jgi:uncharacterized protein YceK
MIRSCLLLLICIVLLSGCAPVQTKDIRVDAQADPKANFSGYKTYAWLAAAAILNDPDGQWKTPSFNATAEIKNLIDRELQKRGLSESDSNPDLVVAFAAGVDMEALKLKMDPAAKIRNLENVPMGGLAVVLVDSKSGFVNWAGVATAEVRKKPDTRMAKERLDYAVTEMFKKLPKALNK